MVKHPPTASAPGPLAPGNLHAQLLDELGAGICSGALPEGSVLTVDTLAEGKGVSRSVVREVLRVLSAMGLVDARRKVGTVIKPASSWNALDPHVIRWRLASRDRLGELRSLLELRTAVEPLAASLAAERSDAREARELLGVATELQATGQANDVAEFLRLDVEFHQRVLRLSANSVFVTLQDVVSAVIYGRHDHELTSPRPPEDALEAHVAVARAIRWRDGDAARAAMVGLMDLAWRESTTAWEADTARTSGGAA